MLEFYKNAMGFLIGDEIWEKLDIALSKWRFNLQASVFDSTKVIIHVGAARRVDALALATGWSRPENVHYFEYDPVSLSNTQRMASKVNKEIVPRLVQIGLLGSAFYQSKSNQTRKLRLESDAPSPSDDWEPIAAAAIQDLGSLCSETNAELVILDEPGIVAQALLSIPKSGLPGNPSILMGSAERSWHQDIWNAGLSLLGELGYVIFDPSGAVLSPTDPIDFALSWYCIAIHLDTLEGHSPTMLKDKLRKVADKFRFEILGPGNLKIAAPAPFIARCEIVSLRTAALVTNSHYASAPCDDTAFDIYSRKVVPKSRPLEVAKFAQVDVFPVGTWKVCVDNTYYVEEIGYSGREQLFGIESYTDWDGRKTVYAPNPVLSNKDTPPNAILLGGDVAYYHWLLNWLPRLRVIELIEREFGHMETLHFVVSERLSQKFLDYVSLILKRPYELTLIPERGVWRFYDLIVPSFCTSHELHPSISHWYRQSLNLPQKVGQKRYYLSRADARDETTPRRKVVNEDAVMAALKPFGFEALMLDNADASQQIELFSKAAFVIGPHGAAFANMQFTPAGAKAIVLENEWNHTFMGDMLTQAGHTAEVIMCKDVINEIYEAKHVVNGEVAPEIRRSRDMLVDCDQLVQRVMAMLA